ncbi:N-terminal fungal transcription regulatory domain-containing protein (zinc finger protein) [Seiridium cupressi]
MSGDGQPRKFLPIQPRPAEGRLNEDEIHQAMSDKKRVVAHSACEWCRTRKTRCDGRQPQCEPCRKRCRKCVYGPEPRMAREAMAAEIVELRKELALSRELKTNPSSAIAPSSTGQLVDTIENPFDVGNILRFLHTNLPVIEDAFVYFNGCTDFLFYSYSEPDAVALLGSIREAVLPVQKSLLCQACAMAAVGSCFSRGKIPAHLGDYFYSVAKMFLDECVESDPRNAIKVCALLTARNIVMKATVALAYIELGLGISRNLGLYDGQVPPSVEPHEWGEQKRIWRCLLTLQFWLQTTLGWSPARSVSLHELTWRDIELQTPRGLEDTEFFQQAMARIAIQKHKLLQVLPNTVSQIRSFRGNVDTDPLKQNIPTSHFTALKRSLQEWYDALPTDAQPSNMLDAPVSSTARFKLYYLHLSHLGARLLLFRCMLRRRGVLGERDDDFHGWGNWMHEGLMTARQSARFSYLMYSEGGAVRHCWLCIFQAYVACCLLLFLCFQKVLKGRIDEEWNDDLALAQKMMEILFYCGELDGVARGFHRTLAGYLTSMEVAFNATHQSILSDGESAGPNQASSVMELLMVPVSGDTELHAAAADLFKLVAWPFGSDEARPHGEDVKAHHTIINHEEVSLGVHTEWVAELTASCDNNGLCDPSRTSSTILSQSPGAFVGSETPNGWITSRSCEAYQEGASTLELLPVLG